MRRGIIILFAVVVLAAVSASAVGYFSWRQLQTPMTVSEPLLFEVPSGTPLSKVSAELESRGLLRYPRVLSWYARLTDAATRIHAGEYELQPGITPVQLLEKLVAGQVFMHQATIVEGWRFADVLRMLRAHPAIRASELDGEGIMSAMGAPDVHPEGQFLPDTYKFPKGTPDVELLRWAHAALEHVLAEAWKARSAELAIETPYEALILASIIEKETALASERRLIAGVFHERLKRGMRLQTDPTVIYGLGDVFDGDLRRRDLSSDTPYNTYTRAGLPPTPIALPSAASLEAAINPEPSDALYFVATGLPDGSHFFSATLEEHNEAVRRYLDILRSAPDQP